MNQLPPRNLVRALTNFDPLDEHAIERLNLKRLEMAAQAQSVRVKERHLRDAINSDFTFYPAWEALIELHLNQNNLKRAKKLIEPLAKTQSAEHLPMLFLLFLELFRKPGIYQTRIYLENCRLLCVFCARTMRAEKKFFSESLGLDCGILIPIEEMREMNLEERETYIKSGRFARDVEIPEEILKFRGP